MLSIDAVDIREGFYGVWVENGSDLRFVPVGRDFKLTKVFLVIEEDTVMFELCSDYGGHKFKHFQPRQELDAIGIKKLMGAGFDVKTNSSSVEIFQALIALKEEQYLENHEMSYIHNAVGWEKITQNLTNEKLQAPLGAAYKSYNHMGNLKSKYDGNMDIKPRGSLEKQIEFIKKEVQGVTPCEVAFSIGCSAVVNGLIRDEVQTSNLIVHFCGDSSQGKTTAAQLAVSVAGIPDLQKISLMKSWNSTDNAIISRCKGNRCMPLVFDEISKYGGKDFTKLVYALSDGRDKERLNRDGTLKKVTKNDSFATTIISTGEESLLNRCNNNTGLKVRVIEISVEFTLNAEHADRIKKGCFENCGWIAPALAEHMQKKGMKYLLERHVFWKNLYSQKTTIIQTLKERVSANYSVILMTAELINEAFGFKFDLEKMLDFFVEKESDTAPNQDIATEAHEKLIDFARSNYSHFTKFYHEKLRGKIGNNDVINTSVWGRIDLGYEKTYDETRKIVGEFGFTVNSFKEILRKLNYSDEKVVLKKLRDAGYLNHEKGKFYRKRKLRDTDGTSTNMYVLYEFEEVSVRFEETFTELTSNEESPFID